MILNIICIVANLGGTLGVCIGASFLTLCEFMQFGVISLIRLCKRLKKPRSAAVTHILPPANTVKPNIY